MGDMSAAVHCVKSLTALQRDQMFGLLQEYYSNATRFQFDVLHGEVFYSLRGAEILIESC